MINVSPSLCCVVTVKALRVSVCVQEDKRSLGNIFSACTVAQSCHHTHHSLLHHLLCFALLLLHVLCLYDLILGEMTHHFIETKMHEMICFLPGGRVQTSCWGETECSYGFCSQVWGEFRSFFFLLSAASHFLCYIDFSRRLREAWSTLTLPDRLISIWLPEQCVIKSVEGSEEWINLR